MSEEYLVSPSYGALALVSIITVSLILILINPSIELASKTVSTILGLGLVGGIIIGDGELLKMEMRK